MTRFIIPLILIIAAIFIFFGPTQGVFGQAEPLKIKIDGLDQALDNAREIQSVRDELQTKYNNLRISDLERLEKLLPGHVDNVRLIIDIDNLAKSHQLALTDVNIQTVSTDGSQDSGEIRTELVGNVEHLDIDMTVQGTYNDMRAFLDNMSRSLRIVDLQSLGFTASEDGLYDFGMSVRTYWLQDKN